MNVATMTAVADKKYEAIKMWLEKDGFDGFTSNDLFIMQFIKKGWGQDIAALSNMAEGLTNMALHKSDKGTEIKPLLIELVRRARHPKVSPYRKDPALVDDFNHYGYYLEHLNIILGCYYRRFGDKFSELNHRVSRYLREESLGQRNAHARLIPHVRMRWSADQAAILHSLWLFDQSAKTDLSSEPIERWTSYMDQHMRHPETGLYNTEVMNVKSYSKEPRGCACSYLTHYTSEFAPDIAQEQWGLMKEHLLTRSAGVTGFREYREGYQGKWTPDSGPIIAGVGVAATGLGLKAAASVVDSETFEKLFTSTGRAIGLLETLNYLPGINKIARIGTDLLATSIYLAALTRFETLQSIRSAQTPRKQHQVAAELHRKCFS